MARLLRQSTQVAVLVGPLIDDTDMKTRETAVAYDAAGIDVNVISGVTKTDVTLASSVGDGYWAHVADGYYQLTLSAAQTGSLGALRVTFGATGVLAAWEDFLVVPANVYDSLVGGTDTLEADATTAQSGATSAIAAAVLAGAVDGSVDLATALRRLLAVVANDAVVTGDDPKLLAYKDSAGSTTVVSQSVPTAGTGRTVTF